jgi:hypothetical protein
VRFEQHRLRTHSGVDAFIYWTRGATMSDNQTFSFDEIPQVRGWEIARFNGVPVVALETTDGIKHPFRFTETSLFAKLADEILQFEGA